MSHTHTHMMEDSDPCSSFSSGSASPSASSTSSIDGYNRSHTDHFQENKPAQAATAATEVVVVEEPDWNNIDWSRVPPTTDEEWNILLGPR